MFSKFNEMRFKTSLQRSQGGLETKLQHQIKWKFKCLASGNEVSTGYIEDNLHVRLQNLIL